MNFLPLIILLCIGSTLAELQPKLDSNEQQMIGPNVTILPPTSPPPETTTKPPTTTTPKTTTSTTTTPMPPPSPNTTTTTSTTPTPPPAPNTTTTTSTTPKTTTTSSTTTAKPSPTPKPGKPEINDFSGNYTGRNTICLMARMAIQLEIKVDKNSSLVTNVPKNPKNEVVCSEDSAESLTINWDSNNITFNFWKNVSWYEIKNVTANIVLPGANASILVSHNRPEFRVSTKVSYLCVKEQALNLTDSQNDTVARLHLSHVQHQAFMNTTEAKYSTVWDCAASNTSDVVPVVVGCILVVMVVLILVAYLFGRRFCHAGGYVSM